MSIKKIAVSAALVAALASKGEAKVNMTKQQAISLKLAQWLGWDARIGESGCGYYVCVDGRKEFVQFNPFSATIDGRAQFAECVIKATQSGFDVHMMNIASRCYSKETMHGYRYHTQDTSPDAVVTATLEAIYYAIGGTAEAKPS